MNNTNNKKSVFTSSKNIDDHRFKSTITNWSNLFSVYTVSYSAAASKTIDSSKKKLSVRLIFILIVTLTASLILAILWFNTIQYQCRNKSIKLSSNLTLFGHQYQINNKLNNQKSSINKSFSITRATSYPSSSSFTSPSSITIEIESTSLKSEEEDGFGEIEIDNISQNQNFSSNNDKINSNDRHLIDYLKNIKNELNRNENQQTNKIRGEEKLDGEYVEHHTISDVPDDAITEFDFLQPGTTEAYTARPRDEKNSNLPEQLKSLRVKQFCNLNSYVNVNKNSSYGCKSNNNLYPNLISSFFCNDKFVIVAKINSLKESVVNEEIDQNEKQFINKYDVHIERILKRSPFLSVAFKKQGLTTNITINMDILPDKFQHGERNQITCFGQRIELESGQTYLLSGRIFGLNAVSSNCDLQLEWFNDLNENQRNQLINWSTSRASSLYCQRLYF